VTAAERVHPHAPMLEGAYNRIGEGRFVIIMAVELKWLK
jgi:hypothetical protein